MLPESHRPGNAIKARRASYLTHCRMRPHYGVEEGNAYLDAAGKTPEDAATGRPGRGPSR